MSIVSLVIAPHLNANKIPKAAMINHHPIKKEIVMQAKAVQAVKVD
jgi:K(+)-stimulated pyrophosphate-energized sodium pump